MSDKYTIAKELGLLGELALEAARYMESHGWQLTEANNRLMWQHSKSGVQITIEEGKKRAAVQQKELPF